MATDGEDLSRLIVVVFFVVNSIFNLVWNYIIAYLIVIFDDVDESGRFVSFYGTASHLTLAIGAYLGALLIREGDYSALLWCGIGAVFVCFTSFLVAVRLISNPDTTE